MHTKTMQGECSNCESTYSVGFHLEFVSQEEPEYCPFCGEEIDDLEDVTVDDEDSDSDKEEWD